MAWNSNATVVWIICVAVVAVAILRMQTPDRGPECVTSCAAAIPATVCPLDRSVQDAHGKVVASTPTVAPGFDFNGCVAACSLASCVAFCGGGR